MLRFLVLATFVTFGAANPVSFTDCGSVGRVLEVRIPGCSTPSRCDFRKGSTYTIEVDVALAANSPTYNLDVKATVSIITVPIINPGNGNGCPGLSSGCPGVGGTTVTHSITITITDEYIETSATVVAKLLNESNGSEYCIRAPVRIVAA